RLHLARQDRPGGVLVLPPRSRLGQVLRPVVRGNRAATRVPPRSSGDVCRPARGARGAQRRGAARDRPNAAGARAGAARHRHLGRRDRETGRRMTSIVHLQKVAGISGSEAHLLALLPRLRERGWDVRMLMLHENEPGAWDFARELADRGVPLDSIFLRADVDPVAFFKLVGYLVRSRPALLHTHLVHAETYGLLAGTAARVPVRFATKHGFNEFREAQYFGLADRAVA